MKIFPDDRLLAAVAAWTASALAVVPFPALGPAIAGALGLLAILVLADAALLARVPPIRAGRRLPARAFVGREAEIALEIENAGRAEVRLDLIDALPADLGAGEPSFREVRAPAHGSVERQYRILPTERGDRALGPLVTLVRSPLGFLRRRMFSETGAVVRVYPDASRFLRPEALDPRRVLASLGARPDRRRGEGMEFESMRDYVDGDDPRRVDWAASARRGRPVVRRHQHERNHRVVIAMDGSRLMGGRVGDRTKLDHAVDAALAIAYAATTSGDRLGMLIFDREVRGYLTPRAGRRGLGPFVELLRTAHPRLVEANYRELARSLAIRERSRALVVIFTDFVEVESAALAEAIAILAPRHRLLLVAVRDRIYGALEVPAGARQGPRSDLYRRLVLNDLLLEREAALAGLRRRGIQTLDLVPEAMTAPVINAYLALRYGPES